MSAEEGVCRKSVGGEGVSVKKCVSVEWYL